MEVLVASGPCLHNKDSISLATENDRTAEDVLFVSSLQHSLLPESLWSPALDCQLLRGRACTHSGYCGTPAF